MKLFFAPALLVGLASLAGIPDASASPLANETSVEVGVASYQYQEPSLGMQLNGVQTSIAGRFAYGLDSNKHLVVDGRWVGGPVDYSSNGSGTNAAQPNYLMELRGMLSLRNPAAFGFFDTYIGLGARYLVNDAAGRFTTTGAYGYTRLSRYQYVPLGITVHSHNDTVETNFEADFLLQGKQTTYLQNYTVQNPQARGTGYRASVLFKKHPWALGPYVNYWTITESQLDAGFYEPANTTTEVGIKLRYDF